MLTIVIACPECHGKKIEVHAVITELRPRSAPLVSMAWLPASEPPTGILKGQIAQAWGESSDMRCLTCQHEALASAFGFSGADVHLNHGPSTLGLF